MRPVVFSSLVAVNLAVVCVAAAEAPSSPVLSFQTPALIQGDLSAEGQWLALIVDAGRPAAFEVTMPHETPWHNKTTLHTLVAAADGEAEPPKPETQDAYGQLPAGTVLGLGFGEFTSGSIFLEARSISVQFSGPGNLEQRRAESNRGDMAAVSERDDEILGTHAAGGPDAVATLRGDNGSSPITIVAQGVTSLEFFAADTKCQGGDSCVTGGGSRWQNVSAPAGLASVSTEWRSFVQLDGSEITVTGQGYAKSLAIGSENLQASLAGIMRLPLAAAQSGCADCILPENQTLWARGDIQFTNLQPHEDGLSAQLSGDVASLRYDETKIDPSLLGLSPAQSGAAIAAAAVGGFLVIKFLVGALFTRLSPERALEHPRRRAIHGFVIDNPGTNFRDIVRETGVSSGTVRHHLTILERSGHLMERQFGGTVRFFENHGRYNATWSTVALLREPDLADLYNWLEAHPGSFQKDVLTGMEEQGWSRSTTQHRVSRLVDGGAVSMKTQGRWKCYAVKGSEPWQAPGTPAPAQALAPARFSTPPASMA